MWKCLDCIFAKPLPCCGGALQGAGSPTATAARLSPTPHVFHSQHDNSLANVTAALTAQQLRFQPCSMVGLYAWLQQLSGGVALTLLAKSLPAVTDRCGMCSTVCEWIYHDTDRPRLMMHWYCARSMQA